MKRTYEELMQLPNSYNRIAPKGRFQLLEVDTFEGPFAETLAGDYPTVEAALAAGTRFKRGQSLLRFYVYDDQGKFIAEADPRDEDFPNDAKDADARAKGQA